MPPHFQMRTSLVPLHYSRASADPVMQLIAKAKLSEHHTQKLLTLELKFQNIEKYLYVVWPAAMHGMHRKSHSDNLPPV